MISGTISSNDNSPYSSPFQSPITSPSSSRGTSPRSSRRFSVNAPSLSSLTKLSLKRANSYRKNSKKSISKLDDLIRKRGHLQRNRSQSDTDINDDDDDVKKKQVESARMRRKKKSVSEDFTEKCKIRPDSTCSEKMSSSRPGSPDRKKSLSQIWDFRRIRDISPKLPRSRKGQIQRSKTFSHDSECDDEGKGPWFLATTMFIPGYDFKTKQPIPLDDSRPHSKSSFLSRRGSKDKSLHSFLEKVQSSPNLLRRGSKDKLEKHVIDQVRSKSKYSRSESPCSFRKDSKLFNHKTESHSDNNGSEYLSVSERSAIIAEKHRNFHDLRKPKNAEPEQPETVIAKGNVKKISRTFESGSIFVKRDSSSNTDSNSTIKFNPKRYSGEYDNIVRERTESFESGEIFMKRDSLHLDNIPTQSSHRNGSESGYASPTESSLSETSTPPQINIISQDTDSSYNNPWKKSEDWGQQNYDGSNFLSPKIKLTNLCMTEL